VKWNSHGYGAHPELQKATELPKAAQEQLGYELLERIDWLSALRADVAIGVHQLEAVQGSASRCC